MEGSVTVPYTPVNGISLYSNDGEISGSSLGGGQPGSVNVTWRIPGGIVGYGNWGGMAEPTPDPETGEYDVNDINNTLYAYVQQLLGYGDYNGFRNSHQGCVFVV